MPATNRPFASRFAALVALAAMLFGALTAHAFPPAPDNILFGTVKDQYGTPLNTKNARVIFVATNGAFYATPLIPGLAPGMNYRLPLPMDAGSAGDVSPYVLQPSMLFKMYVVVGTITNTPLQMAFTFARLSKPATQTRIDLTLGVDANGNGLPDAWERAFIAALGYNIDISTLNPDHDYAGDGRTLSQEFALGNYPFNPGTAFALNMVDLVGDAPTIEFYTMTGRSYSILGSADLQTWNALSFTLPSEFNGPIRTFYSSPDIRILRVQTIQPTTGPHARFFKVLLQ